MTFQIIEIVLLGIFVAIFWLLRKKVLFSFHQGEKKFADYAKKKTKKRAYQLFYQSGKKMAEADQWFEKNWLLFKISLIFAIILFIFSDQWIWMFLPLAFAVYQYLGIIRGVRIRKEKILRRIPFVLDMLILNMESGLDLISALEELVKMDITHPLHQEIKLTLQNIHIGELRSVSFTNLAARTDVAELDGLAMAISQSESMGSSLTELLRIQATEIRNRIFRVAEGKARKAPLKILIPMIAFIFPVIFVLLFYPIGVQILAMF